VFFLCFLIFYTYLSNNGTAAGDSRVLPPLPDPPYWTVLQFFFSSFSSLLLFSSVLPGSGYLNWGIFVPCGLALSMPSPNLTLFLFRPLFPFRLLSVFVFLLRSRLWVSAIYSAQFLVFSAPLPLSSPLSSRDKLEPT